MKRVKIMTTACVALLASASYGQEVGTTKTTKTPLDLISSQTGNVQLRQYTEGNNEPNQDGIDNYTHTTQARTNLTVNTFSDKVATTLTLAASVVNNTKNDDDNKGVVNERRPRVLTEISAYDSAFLALTPSLDLHLPQDGSGTRGDLGGKVLFKTPALTSGIGSFEPSFEVYANAQFSSREEDSKVRTDANDPKSLGITSTTEDDGSVTQKKEDRRGVAYEVRYTPSITWKADPIAKGLDLQIFAEYDNNYEPVLEIDEDGSETTVYEPVRDTWTYLRVGYKVSDTVKLDNYLYRSDTGFYTARGDSDNIRFTNLAMISYTMY